MAKIKTTETLKSVDEFINAVADETKRNDSFRIIELMKNQTGFEPKMWGPSIVGFGRYHYKYDSGHEGESCLVGFSPRKQNITLYLMMGLYDSSGLLTKLGKHKTTKGCVYVKKLADIDIGILKQYIKTSVANIKKLYN